MEQRGTFQVLLVEISRIIQPLADAAEHGTGGVRWLASQSGLDLEQLLEPSALSDLSDMLETIKAIYESLRPVAQNGDVDGSMLPELLGQLPRLFAEIERMNDLELSNNLPLEFQQQFRAVGNLLFDYLVIRYLRQYRPGLYCFLLLIGVIDDTRTKDRLYPVVDYAYLPKVFSDVGGLATDVYRWGSNNFRAALLFRRLHGLLWSIGISATAEDPDPASGMAGTATDYPLPLPELRIPVVELDREGQTAALGVSLIPLGARNGASAGVGLVPFGVAAVSEEITEDGWRITIKASADALIPWGISFRPEAIEVSGLAGSVASPKTSLRFTIESETAPEGRSILLGAAGGPRLELGTLGLTVGFEFDAQRTLSIELPVKGIRIVVDASDGDGFLNRILPKDGIAAAFDLALGVSTKQGVYFRGSGGLEILLPAHVSLGPIDLRAITLAVKFPEEGMQVMAGASAIARLGPLSVVVEDVGIQATSSFPVDRRGNLGPTNLSIGFKPPKGIGLSIDASAVKGGGYLYLDYDKGEYAGALELTVSNSLSLKAIGLINTKMPGGQAAFSLLVIITAEFNPGYQLGYGFVLKGVGGLLGLNRVLLLDPLVQGVRTGAVNNVLFPTDVVANAPRILSDLRAIFPPQDGIFLIGPMAKIGWGTPTLITIALGVIIEIPGNVVILGRLRVALPTDDDQAKLILQVSFVGALEFDKRRIWFFATMYDSRVLFITLDGDMGLLMDFSDNPNFVLSVGGFHPRFTAPPLPFPSPTRVTLSIVNESWARLRAETYFAVTSNSVQMGCRIDAFLGFSAFSVEGYFSFDALLRFSPLYLIVEISTGFSVKVFGVGVFSVHLRGSLEGPTPWRVRGSAEISLLFFSFSVDVDKTFGEPQTDTLPPIEVLPKLRAEFEKLESWRATLPASGQFFVSLRELGDDQLLVLHPVGTLQISQRFAPLNLPLDKIGSQKPSDVKQVAVSVTTSTLSVKGPTKERFAAAQYREMDDAAKLSAPAYEPLESGIELGASGQPWATGPMALRNVRYETIIVDTAFKQLRIRFFKFWDGLFVHFRAGSAVSRTAGSLANEKRMQPFIDRVSVADDRYAVAYQKDNRPYQETATFSSYAEAQAHMAEATRTDYLLTDQIHVIPLAEMNRA